MVLEGLFTFLIHYSHNTNSIELYWFHLVFYYFVSPEISFQKNFIKKKVNAIVSERVDKTGVFFSCTKPAFSKENNNKNNKTCQTTNHILDIYLLTEIIRCFVFVFVFVLF